MKLFRHWGSSFLIALVIALVFRTYVAEAMKVPTGSMIPTIEINDRIVVEKLLWLTDLKHGDIVVFHPALPGEEKSRYVKRLIGLPGDTVEVKDGALYRNGLQVDEPYLAGPMNYTFGPVTVPEGHYFFLGDNRNDSYDGHLWPEPFVSEDRLIGKVLFDIPVHLLHR